MFQEPTDRFSQSEVPLIHETLPELLTLRARLYDIRDDLLKQNIQPVAHVAAEAALLVFDKYMGVMEESDVYEISIVGLIHTIHSSSNIFTYCCLQNS